MRIASASRAADGRRGLRGRRSHPSRRLTRATPCSHVQAGNYLGSEGAGLLGAALEKMTGMQKLDLVRGDGIKALGSSFHCCVCV